MRSRDQLWGWAGFGNNVYVCGVGIFTLNPELHTWGSSSGVGKQLPSDHGQIVHFSVCSFKAGALNPVGGAQLWDHAVGESV